MSNQSSFELTPRQKRLRRITAALLLFIAAQVAIGVLHPFFRPVRPLQLTPTIERALKVKIIFIFGYWTLCLLLVMCLVLVAWMDLREVRRKFLVARRDIWKDILQQYRADRAKSDRSAPLPSDDDRQNHTGQA
jgi:hypothetical protein